MKEYLIDFKERFTTERLIIKSYIEENALEYKDLVQRNSDSINLAIDNHSDRIKSVEDAKVYFIQTKVWSISRSLFIFGIWERESDKLVGQFSINPEKWSPPIFDIGWFLDKESRGKGYITESAKTIISYLFNDQNALKVSARTSEDNEKSANIALRCGMKLEGRIRKATKTKTGEICDELIFGILKEEFLNNK